MADCKDCQGQGRQWLSCQKCEGDGCDICTNMGKILVTCPKCKGSGESK